jgi:uncharacterized protein (TIGR00369 family)
MKELTAAQIKRLQHALTTVPYGKLLGIELEAAEVGQATLSLKVRADLKQNRGVVHGGVIASLIATATAFAILTILPVEEKSTTVDLTISYLGPLSKGKAMAIARVQRAGRRLIVVSAEVFDDKQVLISTALSTYIKI